MSPLFYEDSLGAKLAEKARAAMDAARESAAHPEAVELATSDEALVEDPEALAAAELATRGIDPQDDYDLVEPDWVAVVGPKKLSGILENAGFSGRLLTAPLEAAGIPCVWDPYPPEEMPGFRVAYGAVDRPFSLLIPANRVAEANALLSTHAGSEFEPSPTAGLVRSPEVAAKRRRGVWVLFWVFIGLDLVAALIYALAAALGLAD